MKFAKLQKFQNLIFCLAIFLNGCVSIPAEKFPPPNETQNRHVIGEELVIGPGDVLSIKVTGQPDLTGSYKVAPSGMLYFPLLGSVVAANETPVSLRTTMTTKLQAYIRSPSVSVSVTEFLSQKIYFAGEWNKPGPYVLSEALTLIEAIAVGGNLSRFAKGEIVLIRKGAEQSGNRYRTSLKDILSGVDGVDRIPLRRGDVLYAE